MESPAETVAPTWRAILMVARALIISLVTGSTGLVSATINLGFKCYRALADRHAARCAKEMALVTQYKVMFDHRSMIHPLLYCTPDARAKWSASSANEGPLRVLTNITAFSTLHSTE